jgi:porin
MRAAHLLGLACAAVALSVAHATAEEGQTGADASSQSQGILPIPDYGGDIWEREYLTGDWGGKRTDWARMGFQFEVDNVNWLDDVVHGGSEGDSEFGGNLMYDLSFDLMRAGILPGALIQVRAETRYGSSGILNTGQVTPNNSAALSPTNYSDFDEGYDIALSQLSYLQMFSEHFGVILGKLDLYGEGAANEFAGGRGRTQFANWNLNFPTPALFVPASTLGVGAVVLPTENLTIQTILLSGTECSNSNCFEDLDDKGAISATQVSYQYNLFGLPGGVNGSAIFFFDGDFAEIGSIAIGLGDGAVGFTGSEENTSWQVSGSFWQYLCVEETPDGPLHLLDGKPDLEGWGIFGSLAFADTDTNPWQTSVAFGVGGRGVIPGRPLDLFGIGVFHNNLTSSRLDDTFGFEDDYTGFEAFYNFAITPAVRLSAHVQYLPSVRPGIDDSTMASGRLQFVF